LVKLGKKRKREDNMTRHAAFVFVVSLICCGIYSSGPGIAQSSQFGTPTEAKAMFDKAVAALKADKAKAIDMFNKGEGGFREKDLYVFCFDAKTGIFNAQVVKSLLSTDIRLVKEKDGSPLGQKIFDAVKEGSVNTVQYNFPRPGGDTPSSKNHTSPRLVTKPVGLVITSNCALRRRTQ
jgi:cytochrome c